MKHQKTRGIAVSLAASVTLVTLIAGCGPSQDQVFAVESNAEPEQPVQVRLLGSGHNVAAQYNPYGTLVMGSGPEHHFWIQGLSEANLATLPSEVRGQGVVSEPTPGLFQKVIKTPSGYILVSGSDGKSVRRAAGAAASLSQLPKDASYHPADPNALASARFDPREDQIGRISADSVLMELLIDGKSKANAVYVPTSAVSLAGVLHELKTSKSAFSGYIAEDKYVTIISIDDQSSVVVLGLEIHQIALDASTEVARAVNAKVEGD